MSNQEEKRLEQTKSNQAPWKKWGPYLSERQWGTVREDYSETGEAWDYFTHDQARSRAYRWGEDGIAGICDDQQLLCLAIALWNGQDSILKERLFGLTGNQGNHGEDVKEYYFYLDSTPTHSYLKYLYKYPQVAYPYEDLVNKNSQLNRLDFEYELLDTGAFAEDRYFDVSIEYAKASPDDILMEIKVKNYGKDTAKLDLLPTIWFRNTWSWHNDFQKPSLVKIDDQTVLADHPTLGQYYCYCDQNNLSALLFTENETNYQKLFKVKNKSSYVKDGINDYIVNNSLDAINSEQNGTKAAAHYQLTINGGEIKTVRLRLSKEKLNQPFNQDFQKTIETRQQEADQFYQDIAPHNLSDDLRNIQRQAFAGMLWSKQYYYYNVEKWLKGDSTMPAPSPERKWIRNREWFNLDAQEILSMPDKWEYPWFAAWDLAFHTVTLALVDSDFAKTQLDIMTREWYMHPNGQIPAYEWNFSDVNPPVHAWATWQVYQIETQKKRRSGRASCAAFGDRQFLERVFQKLLMYFTWWVNRKDAEGLNVFQGGFLGLDNIGVFDRSSPLPTGGYLQQSDGTSWMAMYCLNLLRISLELALENPVYEDIATKFFEHFVYIAAAMNNLGDNGIELWDQEDGFFYDVLHFPNDENIRLKVRSMVGLIPLFAIDILDSEILEKLPNFAERLNWFIDNRPDLTCHLASMRNSESEDKILLSLVDSVKLKRILNKMLSESEFLSDYGIRSLSKYHESSPYVFYADNQEYGVDYQPAESKTALFGGNSNWRGPIWMPVNYLLIESLEKFYQYFGDDFKVEYPTGSQQYFNLKEVAQKIAHRLTNIFQKNNQGKRPVYGNTNKFQNDPHWQNLVLFYEYFHGDNGAGIGANHQTGWTGLIANLIQNWTK